MATITNFNSDFDPKTINSFEPSAFNIEIRMYDTGKYMVQLAGLPFDYEEDLADELTLSQARNIKQAMLQGRTYVDMCRIARKEEEKIHGKPSSDEEGW